ncbi:MAG: MFS transporter, partial [Deltaproteobacteria bacterium]|nr:MFS transporter [Deltaproteobacteria bacterium]
TLSGLLLATGTIGNMVAATPLALLMNALGWRLSFAVIGCTTAFLSLVFFLVVRERPAHIPAGHETRSGRPGLLEMIGLLLSRREYWLISLATFFRYGVFVAIQGLWAGPYLINGLGLSPVEAGNILFVLNIGLVVGSPLGGWLSDRILNSRKWAVILGLLIMSLSLFWLSLGFFRHNAVMLGAIFFFLGLSSGFGIIMYAHIKEWVPGDMQGMAFTGINLFTMLGAAVFMQGMGWILDHLSTGMAAGPEDYQKAFFIGFLGTVVALCVYSFTREGAPGASRMTSNRESEDTGGKQ